MYRAGKKPGNAKKPIAFTTGLMLCIRFSSRGDFSVFGLGVGTRYDSVIYSVYGFALGKPAVPKLVERVKYDFPLVHGDNKFLLFHRCRPPFLASIV